MQFQVPQFLDVEDKIVGPFTMKQFLYAGGGIGLAYLFYRFIPWTTIALIPMIASAAAGFALGFYPYNKRPLIFLVEAGFYYSLSKRLYVWKRVPKKEAEMDLTNFKSTKHLRGLASATTPSKLDSTAWMIDMKSDEVTAKKVSARDF